MPTTPTPPMLSDALRDALTRAQEQVNALVLGKAYAVRLAFVALLATPVARGLTRGLPSLPAAALTGAALVLLADLVAGEAVPLLTGAALPTGVLTGAAGAPLMLWLLLRQGRTPGGVRPA